MITLIVFISSFIILFLIMKNKITIEKRKSSKKNKLRPKITTKGKHSKVKLLKKI